LQDSTGEKIHSSTTQSDSLRNNFKKKTGKGIVPRFFEKLKQDTFGGAHQGTMHNGTYVTRTRKPAKCGEFHFHMKKCLTKSSDHAYSMSQNANAMTNYRR
jgi:hypothetical protein